MVSAPTGAGKTGVMVGAAAVLAALRRSVCAHLTGCCCDLQELAILRLLSKHLTPTAATAAAPRPQQHFQPLNGSHKTIYLGGPAASILLFWALLCADMFCSSLHPALSPAHVCSKPTCTTSDQTASVLGLMQGPSRRLCRSAKMTGRLGLVRYWA